MVLVVDMTGPAAALLLGVAERRQVPVAYLRGVAMRHAATMHAGAAKTDSKDAFVLADYAHRHTDRLSLVAIGDPLLTRLRILNSRDTDLAADANRPLLRLREALMGVSPALERAIGDRLASRTGLRDLLERWPTPTALRDVGRARIRARIAKRSPRAADRLADAIWGALAAQTITTKCEATWGEVIADLAGDVNRINECRDQLAKEIKAVYFAHPLGKILDSLCGFGPRTGARALAEIGDPHRFKTANHLAAYAGLIPVDWQSGRTKTIRRTKTGNQRLKSPMYMAASVARRHDPVAKAHYEKKRAEGKGHNAAVLSVARKRCDIILAMLKTQVPYRRPQPGNVPEAA